ncbi:hypothetical protein ACFQY7_06935 [Actinomadura luteofluorescens]|uniref:hypothetical protein n=1 Tax=Actinomadura luteofluorescens TaxID=46163 RepID=UPI00364203DA
MSEHDAQESATTSIRYDALAELLHWMGEHFPLSAGDRVAHLRPPGSAESVRDIFWAMASGAALVLAPPAARPSAGASPAVLEESLVENEVTVAVVPGSPAVAPVLGRCRSLRLVFVPGPLPTASRLELTQVTGVDLVEEYRFPHPVPQSSFWHAGTGNSSRRRSWRAAAAIRGCCRPRPTPTPPCPRRSRAPGIGRWRRRWPGIRACGTRR